MSVFCKSAKIDKRLSNVSVVSNAMLKKNNTNMPKAVTLSIQVEKQECMPQAHWYVTRDLKQYTKYIRTHSKQINSKPDI